MKQQNRIDVSFTTDPIESKWKQVVRKVGDYYANEFYDNPDADDLRGALAVEQVDLNPCQWHVVGRAHGDTVGFKMETDPDHLLDAFHPCVTQLHREWPGYDFAVGGPANGDVYPDHIVMTPDAWDVHVHVAREGVTAPSYLFGDESPPEDRDTREDNVNNVRRRINEAIADHEDKTDAGAPVPDVYEDALESYALGPVSTEFNRMIKSGEVYSPSNGTVKRTNLRDDE